MAKTAKEKPTSETPQTTESENLGKELDSAWKGMQPLRDTWEEKEKTLIAQAADSFSGKVTRARVTDAGLSTLTFERQARVAAQLPTGVVKAMGKKDAGKAKLMSIVLNNYIIPNAADGEDMLTLQRMAGVYASAFGSIPAFYDYKVDDDYIGPYASLVDIRCFLPKPGFHHTRKLPWCMISSVSDTGFLEDILKRKDTSYDKKAIQTLLDKHKVADGKPSSDDDSNKNSYISSVRYDKSEATGRIELITKYEKGKNGRWITFAPDYNNIVIRNIPNPHKSGKIPVVLRQCFPLMNSIIGLGDFDRGMKIQKAKDSLLGLRLEYVKNKTFPALMIDTTKTTPSTIKHGANNKWLVTDMNAVKEFSGSAQAGQEFNAMFSVLNGIQQSQFGTTNADVSAEDSGNAQQGKTPAAINQNRARENARDTWDRFFNERFVSELYEGMINLLVTKMEKPIEVEVFEEEIRQIKDTVGEDVLEMIGEDYGKLTLSKKDLKPDRPFRFIIDANSSMKQDEETQAAVLKEAYILAAQDPMLQQQMQEQGSVWDRVGHYKRILISSGVQDWEQILQEGGKKPGEPGAVDAAGQEQEAQNQAVRQQAIQQVNQLPPELDELIRATGVQGPAQQPMQPQGAM